MMHGSMSIKFQSVILVVILFLLKQANFWHFSQPILLRNSQTAFFSRDTIFFRTDDMKKIH